VQLFNDQRASTAAQLKQQQMMTSSQSAPLQRAEDEELLQGKFDTAQLMEEEEPLQGKFVAQRVEEEEPLQGKFATAQLMEEEEPIQGKFEPLQRAAEEEEPLQGKFSSDTTAQLEQKPNNTGMPDNLKSGIENLSGYAMDDVKVHYNSDKPAQLNAHAYAQGTDIHVAPGQEQHLPHEAWHVVQQKQGRVQPTMQMKAGVPVNDDVGLENEADVMGAQAISQNGSNAIQLRQIEDVASLGSLGLVDTGHKFSVIDNGFAKMDATLYGSTTDAEPVRDKAGALTAIATKAGGIASKVKSEVEKPKGPGYTTVAEKMNKPEELTVDPFTHGHVQTYGRNYVCLMYQQTHGFDGYVNGIEEGVVNSPGNYGRNFAGAMGQKKDQMALLDNTKEGDVARYSNLHDPETGDGTLLEESESGVGGLDATTKLAGEGARFQWVLNNITTIKNDTPFPIGVPHKGAYKNKSASITFQNLWCTWKDWFKGEYNISEDKQRSVLLAKANAGVAKRIDYS
jgi:hypothetical protein